MLASLQLTNGPLVDDDDQQFGDLQDQGVAGSPFLMAFFASTLGL